MKPSVLLVLGIVAVLVAGCTPEIPPLEDRAEYNAGLVNSVLDQAIRNAIIRQHTLFGYHFVDNAATLNELGQHDLELLAARHKEHPGTVLVRQGDTAPELFEARVNEVKRLLVEAGVDEKRVKVEDGTPGGDGMPMARVLVIAGASAAPKPSK
ncbi:hypothetical protein ACFL09_00595 [Planctomycetota bacterium]